MRLIDANKIEYMWKQDRNGKFHDGVTLESIVNNMPTENVNDLIAKKLETIKAEIRNKRIIDSDFDFDTAGWCISLIERTIKGLKEDNNQSRCNNCQNNTDELSCECYECVKSIEDWYEPLEENKE